MVLPSNPLNLQFQGRFHSPGSRTCDVILNPGNGPVAAFGSHLQSIVYRYLPVFGQIILPGILGERLSFRFLHDCFIYGPDTDKSSAAAGQLTVYAHVEPQVRRLAVIFVQLAVAMPVQHDRAVGLTVLGQQWIMAQVQYHVLRQPGAHARTGPSGRVSVPWSGNSSSRL